VKPDHEVAIVGGGTAGLGIGDALRRAGITDFVIFERKGDIGGTWRDNTYPGAACDVPSHLYSLSFAPKRDWTRKWAEQPEILAYLEGLVSTWGLSSHIRFGCEVTSASWTGTEWELEAADGSVFAAGVLVAATGQLSQPHIPSVDGLDGFEGDAFHSARWDHSVPLEGKDVAVIGIGASAIQFVPPVASVAGRVTLFQRSVNYVGPKADREFRPWERWALAHVPGLDRLYRWSIYARFEWRFVAFRRGSRLGELGTRKFQQGLQESVAAQGLPSAAVVPDYPIGCRRILISNDWYPTLFRPNVTVVTSPIRAVDALSVVCADGTTHPADVIVFGTGFAATSLLAPMVVTGVDGVKLADVWAEGAAAYLGMTVAGFPNFFLLYGPNTNLGHNSILVMVERQIEYVLRCLDALGRRGAAAIEVKADAFERDTASVQERVKSTVWAEACHSWYKTATGKVTQNWPGFTVSYWKATLRPRLADYTFRRRG
ncbi:MAG TPA: NAD(P)/FAD-dependent oxidoreductase, partial [Acidimicrobiales bacterium]